jgi:glycosyltransferase involved in cell wall biosynthesis
VIPQDLGPAPVGGVQMDGSSALSHEGDLRVLHVTDVMARRHGGVATAIDGICRGLCAIGVKTAVLATDRDWPTGRIDRGGANPHIHHGYARSLVPAVWAGLGYAPAIDRHLDRFGRSFDIFHIHGLYRYAQYAAARFAKRAGIPYIISPHGALDPFLYYKLQRRRMKRVYEQLIELRNLRWASAIHYTAEDERRLVAGLRIFQTPGFVVPLGFDLQRFAELPARGSFRARHKLGSGPLVLFCGRITPKKGLDLLLPGFAKVLVEHPDAILVLAGPDNEDHWRACQPLAAKLGIEARILLTGMLGEEELMQAYVDADVLALPSYTENFGNVVVEAMLCGTPVLISDRVNIWREIQDSGSGIVVTCSIDAVAVGLLRMLSDEVGRTSMSRNAYAAARRLYGIGDVSRALADHYRRIISAHRRGKAGSA